MSRVVGVDPGPEFTAFVIMKDGVPTGKGLVYNHLFFDHFSRGFDFCVLEKMQCFGMPVGASVFDTAYWIGEIKYRLEHEYNTPVFLVTRQDVKLHHCGSAKAKDANIRQAMLDRFGGKEQTKYGGVLYGFKKDIWSALAIASYGADCHLLARN